MKNISSDAVIAVVVTYSPALHALEQLLTALSPQVMSIVMVDNGSRCDLADWLKRRTDRSVELFELVENRGIAAAQNIGIQRARERGARFVLLMDQDSIPAPDMVDVLVASLTARSPCAAAGPRYLDARQNNPPPFIRVVGLRLVRSACNTVDSVVPVDYLISSGCLIPMTVLDKVGPLREDLFIDYVDIEWGLRARYLGYQSYGACSAHMRHSLGDSPIAFLGKRIPNHSPLRHYYHFRNAVLLYKEPWIPLNWKLVDGWRLCLKYIFYSVFSKPHVSQWWMMTRGIWHGLTGKNGRLAGH